MTVEIPDSWQQLHWKQQVNLAQELSGKDKLEAAEARTIIDQEARRRAAETRAPKLVDPVAPDDEATVPLKLNRDTWQGDIRIRADGRVTMWPLSEAKRLLAIPDLAVRADPLPGEA